MSKWMFTSVAAIVVLTGCMSQTQPVTGSGMPRCKPGEVARAQPVRTADSVPPGRDERIACAPDTEERRERKGYGTDRSDYRGR
ncbi:MAG: hypothetical protein HY898_15030 [Deltaproteobacteria bacterium]|nr:hypothetical protein [Deltaproteobacteria bacterium]